MTSISDNIKRILTTIQQLSPKNPVTLLAVSKTQTSQTILEAYRTGQRNFGENYLQEAISKINDCQKTDIIWHFIGSIQSNKTKTIADNFAWVHSVDRLKIATRLNQHRAGQPPLNICLQINIDNEPTKSGLLIEEVDWVIQQCKTLENIQLRGLMCIPKAGNENVSFKKMQALFAQYPEFDTLSMGMSGDLETAIKHGSNIVRVGRAIFGKRTNTIFKE